MTANLRPERGLSNGTQGMLHSIVLSKDEPEDAYQNFLDAAPGELVQLKCPPCAVYIAVPLEETNAQGLGKTNTGETIIPLLPLPRNITVSRYIKMPKTKNKQTVVAYAHPYNNVPRRAVPHSAQNSALCRLAKPACPDIQLFLRGHQSLRQQHPFTTVAQHPYPGRGAVWTAVIGA